MRYRYREHHMITVVALALLMGVGAAVICGIPSNQHLTPANIGAVAFISVLTGAGSMLKTRPTVRAIHGKPEALNDDRPLVKMTAYLIPKADDALAIASSLSGDSHTDVINRALQLYCQVVSTESNGGTFYVREMADSQELTSVTWR